MKKYNLIVAAAALAAGFIAAPVMAAESPGPWYVGVGLGKSKASDTNSAGTLGGVPFTTSGFDSSETSLQISAGYQFTPIWGVEIQYTDLGKRNGLVAAGAPINGIAAVGDTTAYQFGIAGTGTMALDESWFLRAKLGVSSNHIDSANGIITTAGGTFAFSTGGSSKTDVLAGLAIGYQWTKNISTRLEYEYFGKFGNGAGTTNEPKANNLGMRLQYNF